MSETPPRLLMALALVAAGALTVLSVLIAMVSLPGGALLSGTTLGPLARIQYGTRLLDPGVLLLLPLAVLLARLAERTPETPPHPAARTVLVGAAAVGAASAFLLSLRLVADIGGDARLLPQTLAGSLVYDVGLLLIAVASAFWAYREVGTALPAPNVPVGPSPATESPVTPATPPERLPPPPPPTGFPSGPPLAPPPAQPPP